MGLIKEFKKKGLSRDGRLIISTLKVSRKHNVSGTITGKLLYNKGFITKKGKISAKGEIALKTL